MPPSTIMSHSAMRLVTSPISAAIAIATASRTSAKDQAERTAQSGCTENR